MHDSPQITFRGLNPSEALIARVNEAVERLHRFHESILSCRVAIECPHKHASHGRPIRVRIHVHVPNAEIIADRGERGPAGQDVRAAVDAAFDDVQRKLEDQIRIRRGDVKTHPERRRLEES